MARYTAVILIDLNSPEDEIEAMEEAMHITNGLALDHISVSLSRIVDNEQENRHYEFH